MRNGGEHVTRGSTAGSSKREKRTGAIGAMREQGSRGACGTVVPRNKLRGGLDSRFLHFSPTFLSRLLQLQDFILDSITSPTFIVRAGNMMGS